MVHSLPRLPPAYPHPYSPHGYPTPYPHYGYTPAPYAPPIEYNNFGGEEDFPHEDTAVYEQVRDFVYCDFIVCLVVYAKLKMIV